MTGAGGTGPIVSALTPAAPQSALRFNHVTGRMQVSINGGAYVDIDPGSDPAPDTGGE